MEKERFAGQQGYQEKAAAAKGMSEEQGLDFELEPREFGSDFPVVRRSITTVKKLSEVVSQVFKGIFNDYTGCNIEINKATKLPYLVIYFKEQLIPSNSGKINAIKRCAGVTANNDPRRIGKRFLDVSDVKRYNARFNKQQFELTDEGKEILGKYFLKEFYNSNVSLMHMNSKTVTPKWGKVVTEVTENNVIQQNPFMNPAANIILIKVAYVDIEKLLEKIYGHKDKEGEVCMYRVLPTIIPPTPYVNNDNIVIVMEQMKQCDAKEILGINGNNDNLGGIPRYY